MRNENSRERLRTICKYFIDQCVWSRAAGRLLLSTCASFSNNKFLLNLNLYRSFSFYLIATNEFANWDIGFTYFARNAPVSSFQHGDHLIMN